MAHCIHWELFNRDVDSICLGNSISEQEETCILFSKLGIVYRRYLLFTQCLHSGGWGRTREIFPLEFCRWKFFCINQQQSAIYIYIWMRSMSIRQEKNTTARVFIYRNLKKKQFLSGHIMKADNQQFRLFSFGHTLNNFTRLSASSGRNFYIGNLFPRICIIKILHKLKYLKIDIYCVYGRAQITIDIWNYYFWRYLRFFFIQCPCL